MLTEAQKISLEKQIYRMLKESIFENGMFENPYFEDTERKEKKESKPKHKEDSQEISGRRESVMKWLDSAQELHSVLSYELWPDKEEDDARSLFSKKYRGHSQGKSYEFTPEEINKLYNLRGDFISDAGLD